MNKRLENIKANAKSLCKPTTAGDTGVVLNVVWLETIEELCDEVVQLEAENETLKAALGVAMSENQRLTKIVEDYEEK